MLDQTTNVSASSGNVEMSFTSGAWQVVRVDASEIGGVVDFELRLVDAFNNIIGKSTSIQSEQGASIDEFTLPYDGMYRVVLAPSNGDGSVQVKVTALDAPSGGGQVSLGDSLTGTMSVKVVYHTYQVSLTGGAVVTFVIREYAKVEVKKITFLGNAQIPDSELKNIIATHEGDFSSLLTSFGNFKEVRD